MVVHTLPVFQETRELLDFQKFETFFRRSPLRNSCTRRRKRKLENEEKTRDILRYLNIFCDTDDVILYFFFFKWDLAISVKTKIIASLIYTSVSIIVSYQETQNNRVLTFSP